MNENIGGWFERILVLEKVIAQIQLITTELLNTSKTMKPKWKAEKEQSYGPKDYTEQRQNNEEVKGKTT